MGIVGYKRLKNCKPGSLIRLKSGDYAVVSEYRSNENSMRYDAYLIGSGEYLHSDGDEWVIIADIRLIEVEIAEEVEYPE